MISNRQQIDSEFTWWLANFVCRGRSLLEIGTSAGISLLNMARAMPIGARVRSIDLGVSHLVWDEYVDCRSAITAAMARLRGEGYDAEAFFGDSRSEEAIAWAANDGPYDIVFIDADHGYEAVRDDWLNYGPMGQVVGLHDVAHLDVDGPRRLWFELTSCTDTGPALLYSIKQSTAAGHAGIGVVVRNGYNPK